MHYNKNRTTTLHNCFFNVFFFFFCFLEFKIQQHLTGKERKRAQQNLLQPQIIWKVKKKKKTEATNQPTKSRF